MTRRGPLLPRSKQRHQQSFTVSGRPVEEILVASSFVGQARLPEDTQVAADPALLATRDQASVADAKFPGLSEQSQKSQSVRIAQRVGLATAANRFGLDQQLLVKFPSARLVNGLQAQVRVPHLVAQTNSCAYVDADQVHGLKGPLF